MQCYLRDSGPYSKPKLSGVQSKLLNIISLTDLQGLFILWESPLSLWERVRVRAFPP